MSGRGSSKVMIGLEDNRRAAFGGFLHFLRWQSMLSAVHPAQVHIGAAAEK